VALVLLLMLLLYLLLRVVAVVDRDLMVVEIQLVLLVDPVAVAAVVIHHNPAHLQLPVKEIKAELLHQMVQLETAAVVAELVVLVVTLLVVMVMELLVLVV
jgi:hypothetical protein